MSPADTRALHLLRHADAGDPAAWTGDDADRPLSDKGVAQSERLGAHLAALGVDVGPFVTSPKRRAMQTAEIVAAAVRLPVRVDDRLGVPLTLSAVERIVREGGERRGLVLVGHDPDFSELLTALVGGAPISMKKGALARVDVQAFEPGGGELRWLLPPSLLPRG